MTVGTAKSAPSLNSWLRDIRGPYLNFLRNLTPQILLASLAWVWATKLDFEKADFSNSAPTLAFFAFLLLFGFSVYSNISLFLAEAFPGLMPWVREQELELKTAGVAKLSILKQLVAVVMRERKLEIALVFLAVVMLEFVLAGVLVSSIGAAVNFIRVLARS